MTDMSFFEESETKTKAVHTLYGQSLRLGITL